MGSSERSVNVGGKGHCNALLAVRTFNHKLILRLVSLMVTHTGRVRANPSKIVILV